jgi:hypothetical protein
VELGRVDIDVEVSMMSSHLALPREGHLKEVYHIFAYLKAHPNAEMVFDLTPVEVDKGQFEHQDWSYSANRRTSSEYASSTRSIDDDACIR